MTREELLTWLATTILTPKETGSLAIPRGQVYLVFHDLVIPMKFAREKDARTAIFGIVDAADWVGPIERLADYN